jgi:mono/diheme cytochrome c family protein
VSDVAKCALHPLSRWAKRALVLLATSCSAVASAQVPTPVPPSPEDPAAAKAYAVLEQNCARCHQAGKVTSHPPVQDFGNILDLAAVARDPSLVHPGNPDGSRLYTMMLSRAMPYDVYHEGKPGPGPNAKDLDAIREWILGLKPGDRCKDVMPLAASTERELMERALEALPPEGRSQVRFVSLSHLHNACAGPQRIGAYRQAVTHLLNSLSWALATVRFDTIDPAESILRIDLSAIGWSAETWERLTSSYPYASAPGAGSEVLRKVTSAAIPAVRGDWLAFAATRAPLYYHLLGLPDRSRTLATSLRIDLDATAPTAAARRAAIKTSMIAQGARLIERFQFANGGYWRTLEYAPGASRADPFDPASISAGRTTGKPDASLTIFALPNGLSAFFMTNGEGQRINEIPASVLRDPAHRLTRVTTGISCFGCHSAGAKPVTDELRALVAADRAATKETKDRVAVSYPDSADFGRLVREDNERVAAALTAANVDPALTIDGVAPVVALSSRYDRRLGADDAAAELGIASGALPALAAKLKGDALHTLQRLIYGTITRRDFELHYATFAAAAAGTDVAPGSAFSVAHPALLDDAETIDLALTTDRTSYRSGDLITLLARPTASCHLTIVNIDRKGRGTVLFPNEFEQANYVEAGREVQIPGPNAPYQLRVRERGAETFVGICSPTQKVADGIKPDFERQRFTELGDYRSFLNRTFDAETAERRSNPISVPDPRAKRVAKRGKQEASSATPELRRATSFQARTAIQIDVK